jgi:N-acetylmuramoyl-L-alanine amidase
MFKAFISIRFLGLLAALLLLPSIAAGATTIIIDAGHGGFDRGGMPGQRIPEKGYALDVAQRLDSALRRSGFRTVMTRKGDYFVTLGDRCAIANRNSKAVFVSIHFNGAPNRDASGIETYYYKGRESAALASAIHKKVLSSTGAENRWVRSRGLYVLRHTNMPSVLCELGFLTNAGESRRIASSSYRQRLAEAIASAIRSRYR